MFFYFVPIFSGTKNVNCAKLETLCFQFCPHHLFPKGGKWLGKNGKETSTMYKESELEHQMAQNYRFAQKERKNDGRRTCTLRNDVVE
jgi:hypothetical protein